jgi:hypothetical protein
MYRVIYVAMFLLVAFSARAEEGRIDFYIECIPNSECVELPFWDGQRGSVRVGKEPALSVSAGEISEVKAEKSEVGMEQVSLVFGDEAKESFARITAANQQKTLAVVTDGKVLLAPRIMSPILDGRIVISFGSAGSGPELLFAAVPWLKQKAQVEKEESRKNRLIGLFGSVALGIFLIGGAIFYAFGREENKALN